VLRDLGAPPGAKPQEAPEATVLRAGGEEPKVLCWLPGGARLAVGGVKGQVHILVPERGGKAALLGAIEGEAKALAASPQLEAFRAKGVEVLLLTDPIDEFWVPALGSYKDKPFVSVTRGEIDLGAIEGTGEAPAETREARVLLNCECKLVLSFS